MKRVLITIFAIILVAMTFSGCTAKTLVDPSKSVWNTVSSTQTNPDMNVFTPTPQQIVSKISPLLGTNGTISDSITDKITGDGQYHGDADINVYKGDTVYNYLVDKVIALRIFANPANEVWDVTVSEAVGNGDGGGYLREISAKIIRIIDPKLNPPQCTDEYNKLASESLPASDVIGGISYSLNSYTSNMGIRCCKFEMHV